jgi:hypothetical protein
MPKITINQFITKHTTGVCVLLQFFDYKRDKDAARKARRRMLTVEGKEIPTPSQVITKLVASFAKGDYALQSLGESERTGVRLQVIFKDPAEAQQLAKVFAPAAQESSFKRGDGKPCSSGLSLAVDGSDQTRIAKEFGLV